MMDYYSLKVQSTYSRNGQNYHVKEIVINQENFVCLIRITEQKKTNKQLTYVNHNIVVKCNLTNVIFARKTSATLFC